MNHVLWLCIHCKIHIFHLLYVVSVSSVASLANKGVHIDASWPSLGDVTVGTLLVQWRGSEENDPSFLWILVTSAPRWTLGAKFLPLVTVVGYFLPPVSVLYLPLVDLTLVLAACSSCNSTKSQFMLPLKSNHITYMQSINSMLSTVPKVLVNNLTLL